MEGSKKGIDVLGEESCAPMEPEPETPVHQPVGAHSAENSIPIMRIFHLTKLLGFFKKLIRE